MRSLAHPGYILLGHHAVQTESAALNIAASAVFAKFSRDDEREADRAVRALPPPPPPPAPPK